MTNDEQLLIAAYRALNARELEAALATLYTDVEWPNTMEGGTNRGHDGVGAYWTKQWNMVDPVVEPLQFSVDGKGRIVIAVLQVVRDLQGQLLEDLVVQHTYQMQHGLIRRMEMGED